MKTAKRPVAATRIRPAAARGIGPTPMCDGRSEIRPEQCIPTYTAKHNPAHNVLMKVEKELKEIGLDYDDVRLLVTLAQILKRGHGTTTPSETFVESLLLRYRALDEQGIAINEGDIEDLLKEFKENETIMFTDGAAWVFRNREVLAAGDGSFVASW